MRLSEVLGPEVSSTRSGGLPPDAIQLEVKHLSGGNKALGKRKSNAATLSLARMITSSWTSGCSETATTNSMTSVTSFKMAGPHES